MNGNKRGSGCINSAQSVIFHTTPKRRDEFCSSAPFEV